jgi:hypothetical protein
MTVRKPHPERKPWKRAVVPQPSAPKPTWFDVLSPLAIFLFTCAAWIQFDLWLVDEPRGRPWWYVMLAAQKGSSVEMLQRLLPFVLAAAAITTLAVFVVRVLRRMGIEDGTLEDRIRKFVGAPPKANQKQEPWSGPFGVRLLAAGTTATAAAATIFLVPSVNPPRVAQEQQGTQTHRLQANVAVEVVPDVRVTGPLRIGIEPKTSDATLPLRVSATADGLKLPLQLTSEKHQVQVAFTREEHSQPLRVALRPTVVDEQRPLNVNFPDLLARLTLLEQTSWNLLRTVDGSRRENADRYVARGSPYREPAEDRNRPDTGLRASLPSTGDTSLVGPPASAIPPTAVAVAESRLPERCSAAYFQVLESAPAHVVQNEARFDYWGFSTADRASLVKAIRALCDALSPPSR